MGGCSLFFLLLKIEHYANRTITTMFLLMLFLKETPHHKTLWDSLVNWVNDSIFRKLEAACESESRPVVSDSLQVHEILQARILEWVTFPFSRGSSQPKDWTQVSCIAGGFFTSWAIREPHENGRQKQFSSQDKRIMILSLNVGLFSYSRPPFQFPDISYLLSGSFQSEFISEM